MKNIIVLLMSVLFGFTLQAQQPCYTEVVVGTKPCIVEVFNQYGEFLRYETRKCEVTKRVPCQTTTPYQRTPADYHRPRSNTNVNFALINVFNPFRSFGGDYHIPANAAGAAGGQFYSVLNPSVQIGGVPVYINTR